MTSLVALLHFLLSPVQPVKKTTSIGHKEFYVKEASSLYRGETVPQESLVERFTTKTLSAEVTLT